MHFEDSCTRYYAVCILVVYSNTFVTLLKGYNFVTLPQNGVTLAYITFNTESERTGQVIRECISTTSIISQNTDYSNYQIGMKLWSVCPCYSSQPQ